MSLNNKIKTAEILSVEKLLTLGLNIPNYQRPYKWGRRNITDLLEDISNAVSRGEKDKDFKYRIGSIILHREEEKLYIVDGQQRIISLVLLMLYIDSLFNSPVLNKKFDNKESQQNIYNNYETIKGWFSSFSQDDKEKIKNAFDTVLEVVVFYVDKEAEAFQLFDSQNTRGKPLDPHDILKAYHLREMNGYPNEMRHAVTKWESKETAEIRELFNSYLFPIKQWTNRNKSFTFTVNDIDPYKGISEKEDYTYARRVSKAAPIFQITEPFTSGSDFFTMVDHYLTLKNDIKEEGSVIEKLKEIEEVLDKTDDNSTGYKYAKNLFYCAVLAYYDKFRNFDTQAITKLFSWAFMLRVDMEKLGFESINKYAIGEWGNYTNNISIFWEVYNARLHKEIANMEIKVKTRQNKAKSKKWERLYDKLQELNGVKEGGRKE